jgi:hypothetical protein
MSQTPDNETHIIGQLVTHLDSTDEDTQRRILIYLVDRYLGEEDANRIKRQA